MISIHRRRFTKRGRVVEGKVALVFAGRLILAPAGVAGGPDFMFIYSHSGEKKGLRWMGNPMAK